MRATSGLSTATVNEVDMVALNDSVLSMTKSSVILILRQTLRMDGLKVKTVTEGRGV